MFGLDEEREGRDLVLEGVVRGGGRGALTPEEGVGGRVWWEVRSWRWVGRGADRWEQVGVDEVCRPGGAGGRGYGEGGAGGVRCGQVEAGGARWRQLGACRGWWVGASCARWGRWGRVSG